MTLRRRVSLGAVILLLASRGVLQAQPSRALAPDQPQDAAHPSTMAELGIPSGGERMNGLIYLATGAGPHPVAVFLHGYPGNEKNLDLAQAVRRAGWNALYFDYRGSWGSGGTFGFQHALDDVAAALAWLRTPAVAARFSLDTTRIVLVGHSMGGWLALHAAARDPRVRCVAALAAWNVGDFGRTARSHPERDPGAYFRQTTDPHAGPIRANAADLLREATANAERWDYLTLGPALHQRPLLLVAATHDDPDEDDAMRLRLTAALHAAGATRVRSLLLDDDHPFSAHRLALGALLGEWLNGECGAH
jgi:pimeloyl-ACP methyl ester carboxylesterase